MPPKAKTDDDPQPAVSSTVSGKLLIIGILTIAVVAAATSWWFRYNATHRSAAFWGPEYAQLIRDAPRVILIERQTGSVEPTADNSLPASALANPDLPGGRTIDISNARGLLHLRNALLEDHNFDWPARDSNAAGDWHWCLQFGALQIFDRGTPGMICFSADCKLMLREHRGGHVPQIISTELMAKGLREMFAEFTTDSDSAK